MPPIEINTMGGIGLALVSVSAPLTVYLWKCLPSPRRRYAAKEAVDIAVLSTEMKHIREDVGEIKLDIKTLQERLGCARTVGQPRTSY